MRNDLLVSELVQAAHWEETCCYALLKQILFLESHAHRDSIALDGFPCLIYALAIPYSSCMNMGVRMQRCSNLSIFGQSEVDQDACTLLTS